MKEELITSLQVPYRPGTPLSIRYYLLEETREDQTLYGIKISEETGRTSAVAPGLTGSRQRAAELIALLARGTVTPTGLADVLADLL